MNRFLTRLGIALVACTIGPPATQAQTQTAPPGLDDELVSELQGRGLILLAEKDWHAFVLLTFKDELSKSRSLKMSDSPTTQDIAFGAAFDTALGNLKDPSKGPSELLGGPGKLLGGRYSWDRRLTGDELARHTEWWRLTQATYQAMLNRMGADRKATISAIGRARARWEGFAEGVVEGQLPHEFLINGLLGPKGNIESPPTWQHVVLHPSPTIELRNNWNELETTKAVAVSVYGVEWYKTVGSKLRRSFGVSFCASFAEGVDRTGWGGMVHLPRDVSAGYVYRAGDINAGSYIVSWDLYGLIPKGVAAGLAGDKLAELEVDEVDVAD